MDSSLSLAHIPQSSRIVIRTYAGRDDDTGRQLYRDFVGHVIQTHEQFLILERDASANGKRAAQIVRINANDIVRLKPIPERPSANAAQRI
ncbi:DUF6725 family protein [Alloscardovia venturai]|uniref:DUF6725 family protein n=1 Tax=Alloscardovia venturai TaxID=1769421 RepID=A0ABW2YAF2_9BIFI